MPPSSTLCPRLMPSRADACQHKRLRVGRIGLHGPYLSVPGVAPRAHRRSRSLPSAAWLVTTETGKSSQRLMSMGEASGPGSRVNDGFDRSSCPCLAWNDRRCIAASFALNDPVITPSPSRAWPETVDCAMPDVARDPRLGVRTSAEASEAVSTSSATLKGPAVYVDRRDFCPVAGLDLRVRTEDAPSCHHHVVRAPLGFWRELPFRH